MKNAGLYVIVFAAGIATCAQAAPAEREAVSRPESPGGIQLAKGSPASRAFGNPFKAPSETMLDMEPTGSISTSGKTPPGADDKIDAAPSVTAPPAKKRRN